MAEARGKTARIAMRVNPDVDAKTHHKIATGKAENKFGVPFAEAPALYRLAPRASRHRGCRRAYAYRQPDHRPRALPECLRAAQGAGRHAARHKASPSPSSISAAASAFPTGATSLPRRFLPNMRELVKDEVGDLGVRAPVRARAA